MAKKLTPEQRAAKREANKALHRIVVTQSRSFKPVPLTGRKDAIEPELPSILEEIAKGGTLRKTCRDKGLDEAMVRRMFHSDPELKKAYEIARQLQAEAWADVLAEDIDAKVDYTAEGAMVEVAHKKYQADARRWLMAKNHVGRFGDKVAISGDQENPLIIEDARAKLLDKINRVIEHRRTEKNAK